MSARNYDTCAALVPRSSGSWFDFTGCLNDPRPDFTPVIDDEGFMQEIKLCGTHRRMIEDGKPLDVHDGTYTAHTNRPVIVTARKAQMSDEG